ncbi:hypothetical protein S40285_06900 [Stachybotrys chlorohalonatus IBT 40285]|uniref:Glycosyltransferase 2-like domain-containing protein n=1 Tax=Stachybotrys chlorohalonatus (strain IBT 40285) TaxID=1283841 RepID=A0A084Q970_STAC4|nr:hypothetical protein S40285_06900 [Stachybotrys chlorohalonata IBT 40285]
MAKPVKDKRACWLWVLRIALVLAHGPPIALAWSLVSDDWMSVFITLYTLRYVRLIGDCIGWMSYKPAPVLRTPRYAREHVSVIIPTVDPKSPEFTACIESISSHGPACVYLSTVGPQLHEDCEEVLENLRLKYRQVCFKVFSVVEASKRRQIAQAMPYVSTPVTILADDHVFWPHHKFLSSVLAPLDDDDVGVVATKKQEYRASDALDNGLYVVSGRTAVYLTDFLKDSKLLERFCNEKFFFGRFGGDTGLGPDDDNFLTREILKRGKKIRFQYTDEATVETTLGEWPKLWDQNLRWARTTWRSNPVMLRDVSFFTTYTWSYFMVYWARMVNFALFWDVGLLLSFSMSQGVGAAALIPVMVWILATKFVKCIPLIMRQPADLPLMIFQVAFGYVHSFIKFWSLLTFWNHGWSGRDLAAVNFEAVAHFDEKPSDHDDKLTASNLRVNLP